MRSICLVIRAFSHDVSIKRRPYWCFKTITAAILAFQTNPVGVEHFSYVKNFFYSNTFSLMMWTCEWKCSIGQFFWIARIYTRHRGWEVKQKKWGIDLFNLNAISFVFSLQTLHPRKNFNNIRQHSHSTPAHCNTEFYIHLRFKFLLQKTSLFCKYIYIQIVRMSKTARGL